MMVFLHYIIYSFVLFYFHPYGPSIYGLILCCYIILQILLKISQILMDMFMVNALYIPLFQNTHL